MEQEMLFGNRLKSLQDKGIALKIYVRNRWNFGLDLRDAWKCTPFLAERLASKSPALIGK